jgi:glycosyltransferase involved in cell wall biosynthesis
MLFREPLELDWVASKPRARIFDEHRRSVSMSSTTALPSHTVGTSKHSDYVAVHTMHRRSALHGIAARFWNTTKSHIRSLSESQASPPEPAPLSISAQAALEKMIAQARTLEPNLNLSPRDLDLRQVPHVDGVMRGRLADAWSQIFRGLRGDYDWLVFVPSLKRGGAERVVANVVAALEKTGRLDRVLVVATDDASMAALEWMPRGTDILLLDDVDRRLTNGERTEIARALMTSLRPHVTLVVNSRAAWDAVARWGCALGEATSIVVTAFCSDFNDEMHPIGFADTHLARSFEAISEVWVDSEIFRNELIERFQLPLLLSRKLVRIYHPISDASSTSSRVHEAALEAMKPRRILWAGRITKQKNPDLICAIATRLPHVEFHVYGHGEASRISAIKRVSRNLQYKGAFASTTALPLHNYDAFIYTSLWDGLPLTILEIGAAGLPIIAPAVGGICEVIDQRTGWLIRDPLDVDSFVEAISRVLKNPLEASRRASELVALVKSRHSVAQFEDFLLQTARAHSLRWTP